MTETTEPKAPSLEARLDQILPKVISDDFLSGRGIGNEIAYYIFDYPAARELVVREHIAFLLQRIPREKPGQRVLHVNLFDLIIDMMRQRRLLEKAFTMQLRKSDDAFRKTLAAPLTADKVARALAARASSQDGPGAHDLIFLSGVGNAYPLVRVRALLSALQSVLDRKPLVVFYPGEWDRLTLRLFGKSTLQSDAVLQENRRSKSYYRAFRLV